MPKKNISKLSCEEMLNNGSIEIRSYGQFNTQMHQHDKAQLISPEKGTAYLYSSHGSFCIPAHYYAYIASNTEHKLISRSPDLKLRTVFIDLSKEVQHTYNIKNISVFYPSSLLDYYLEFGEAHWNDENLRDICLPALIAMLPHLLKNPLKLNTHPPESELLLKLTTYIQHSLSEKLTVSLLAQKFNISERSLSRCFKQETGITLFQYIKLSRMQRAIELLENKTLNISEVVYEVGYESISTFSTLFKDLMGTSPQKYRQQFLE